MQSLKRIKKSISNTLLQSQSPSQSQSASPSKPHSTTGSTEPLAYNTTYIDLDMDQESQTPVTVRQRDAELSLYDARLISVDDALTFASLLFGVLSTHQLLTLDVDPDVAFNSLLSTILFLLAFFLALIYRSTPILMNIITFIDDITLRITARIIGYISNLCFSAGIFVFLLGGTCIQLRRYQDLSYPSCTAIISPLLLIATLNIIISTYILFYRIRNEYNNTIIIDNRSTSATERTPLLHFPMFK